LNFLSHFVGLTLNDYKENGFIDISTIYPQEDSHLVVIK